MQPLERDFFMSEATVVAQQLLGKQLVTPKGSALITEVEAYGGADDAASHAYKHTPRSALMYGEPGFVYVYLIYGMHYCLNFVTSPMHTAGAVLIRGVYKDNNFIYGPGKVTKALGIDKNYNGLDTFNNDKLFAYDVGFSATNINTTTRVGISKAKHKLWRFYLDESSLLLT